MYYECTISVSESELLDFIYQQTGQTKEDLYDLPAEYKMVIASALSDYFSDYLVDDSD